MTKKELLEKIKNTVQEKEIEIGKLNEEELAIFILWQLIQEKSFDSRFYFGTGKTRDKIYQLAKQYSIRRPVGNEEAKKNLICVSLTAEYKYIAEELGLNVSLERMSRKPVSSFNQYSGITDLENNEHLFNIVHCSNGRNIRIDVQKEIARMQTGCMPRHINLDFYRENELFRMPTEKQRRNQEQVDKILRKLGYIGVDKQYTDDYCKQLIDENPDATEVEIARRILQNPEIQERIKSRGASEVYTIYKSIFREIIPTRYVSIIPCYIERKFGQREYTICIYADDKNDYEIWMYSKRDNKMKSIHILDIEQLMANGLEFETSVDGESLRIKKALELMATRTEEIHENQETSFQIEEVFDEDEVEI